MKKIMTTILFLAICASLLMSVASADSPISSESEYVYIEGNTEIRIEKGNMTDEQIKKVLYAMLGKEYPASQVYGLTCSIFGHNYETTRSTATDHKVHASSPRCVRHIYEVHSCTRCDYVEAIELEQKRIICCP